LRSCPRFGTRRRRRSAGRIRGAAPPASAARSGGAAPPARHASVGIRLGRGGAGLPLTTVPVMGRERGVGGSKLERFIVRSKLGPQNNRVLPYIRYARYRGSRLGGKLRRKIMTNRPVLKPSADHPITVASNPQRIVVKVGDTVVADTHEALTLREANY